MFDGSEGEKKETIIQETLVLHLQLRTNQQTENQ